MLLVALLFLLDLVINVLGWVLSCLFESTLA
jgi:hypothetical protein